MCSTFRFVTHFKLIFGKGVRFLSRFFSFFFACGCPVVLAPFAFKFFVVVVIKKKPFIYLAVLGLSYST